MLYKMLNILGGVPPVRPLAEGSLKLNIFLCLQLVPHFYFTIQFYYKKRRCLQKSRPRYIQNWRVTHVCRFGQFLQNLKILANFEDIGVCFFANIFFFYSRFEL